MEGTNKVYKWGSIESIFQNCYGLATLLNVSTVGQINWSICAADYTAKTMDSFGNRLFNWQDPTLWGWYTSHWLDNWVWGGWGLSSSLQESGRGRWCSSQFLLLFLCYCWCTTSRLLLLLLLSKHSVQVFPGHARRSISYHGTTAMLGLGRDGGLLVIGHSIHLLAAYTVPLLLSVLNGKEVIY